MHLDAGKDGISKQTFNLDGGTLYIFTDGVTEGHLQDGSRLTVEGFQTIISERASLTAAGRIDAVVAALTDTGRKRHDDITLLAVEDVTGYQQQRAVDETRSTSIRHRFPARAEALHEVREVVSNACETCGCNQALATDLIIAVGEACQNIVRHAYKDADNGDAELEIRCDDGILEFLLQDSAPAVDKDKIKPRWPEQLEPGGLGICLIHDIMDEVEYLPVPPGKGNLLRMAKFIDREPGK
jgi:sigma-B regulation protein RsbU (phosphoserine phosphatase)